MCRGGLAQNRQEREDSGSDILHIGQSDNLCRLTVTPSCSTSQVSRRYRRKNAVSCSRNSPRGTTQVVRRVARSNRIVGGDTHGREY